MSPEWEAASALALALPGTELATYYAAPAVKANGRPLLTPGREPGSICLHVDRDTVEMLKTIAPDIFWQTPHYAGWPAVLIRYADTHTLRIADAIATAHAQAMAQKPPRKRPGR